jgi:hypothetical protein
MFDLTGVVVDVPQDVQGVPAPGREPEDAPQPRAEPGAQADQVLVPEPQDADEGTLAALPSSHQSFSPSFRKKWFLIPRVNC